jgi:hypothetical protein
VGFSLPDITEPLNVDGTTQPGFAGTPLILVRGPAGFPFAATWGFRFVATAPGSTVRPWRWVDLFFRLLTRRLHFPTIARPGYFKLRRN